MYVNKYLCIYLCIYNENIFDQFQVTNRQEKHLF